MFLSEGKEKSGLGFSSGENTLENEGLQPKKMVFGVDVFLRIRTKSKMFMKKTPFLVGSHGFIFPTTLTKSKHMEVWFR